MDFSKYENKNYYHKSNKQHKLITLLDKLLTYDR